MREQKKKDSAATAMISKERNHLNHGSNKKKNVLYFLSKMNSNGTIDTAIMIMMTDNDCSSKYIK